MEGAPNVFLGREGSGAATVLPQSNLPDIYLGFLQKKQDEDYRIERERRSAEEATKRAITGFQYEPANFRFAQVGLDMKEKALKNLTDKAIVQGFNSPETIMDFSRMTGQLDKLNLAMKVYGDAVTAMEKAINTSSDQLDPETFENYRKLTSFEPTEQGLMDAVAFSKSKPLIVPKFNVYDELEPLILELREVQKGNTISNEADTVRLDSLIDQWPLTNEAAYKKGREKGFWQDKNEFKQFVYKIQETPYQETKPTSSGKGSSKGQTTFVNSGGGRGSYGNWTFALDDANNWQSLQIDNSSQTGKDFTATTPEGEPFKAKALSVKKKGSNYQIVFPAAEVKTTETTGSGLMTENKPVTKTQEVTLNLDPNTPEGKDLKAKINVYLDGQDFIDIANKLSNKPSASSAGAKGNKVISASDWDKATPEQRRSWSLNGYTKGTK